MQDFFFPFSAWTLTTIARRIYWEDLEAIYSNSNILFLHKDAEILFFGIRIYILWSEKLPCINYGSVISRLLWGTFSRSKAPSECFHCGEVAFFFIVWGLCRRKLLELPLNSTPYSTYSLNLVIKWASFPMLDRTFNILCARFKKEAWAINFILDGFYWFIWNDNKLF